MVDSKNGELRQRTECAKRHLLNEAKWLIEYYLKLNEEITRRILNIRLHAIIALGFGLIAISLLKPHLANPLMNLVWVLYLLPLVLVIVWSTKAVTSSKYIIIHKNPWRYFYYGNPHILQIDIETTSERNEQAYENGFSLFVNNFKTESEDDELENALRHAYNLQVLNYYKNRYYLMVRKFEMIWVWCLVAVVFIISLTL